MKVKNVRYYQPNCNTPSLKESMLRVFHVLVPDAGIIESIVVSKPLWKIKLALLGLIYQVHCQSWI